MAEIDKAVMVNVALFLEHLKAAGIQIADAYLFGSRLTGTVDEWSDIDVAIVSPQISEDRFEERVRLTRIAFAVDERIEPLPFNPASFTLDDPLVREILKTGIPV
jgi:predicted nucleotidyltransferase